MRKLLFKIDRTGSMKGWIDALNRILPLLTRSISLTQLFDKVGILTYGDYDSSDENICSFSGFKNCSQKEDIDRLQNFASSIKANGGGGRPEAWKTALEYITSISTEGVLYVIHLTDAPPHEKKSLDSEGKKEQNALGELFDYAQLADYVLTKITNIKYTCLSSCKHPIYSHFAQRTGSYMYHVDPVTSDNIKNKIASVINGWMGLDNPINNPTVIDNIIITSEDQLSSQLHQSSNVEEVDNDLRTVFNLAVSKMRSDPVFLEHVVSELVFIIESDPMMLTISDIIGKIWREFSKRRSDIRRDELIERLNCVKHRLSDVNRKTLDDWLTQSYNSIYEIEDDLKKYISTNRVEGLIRFASDMNIVEIGGTNISLCAQQMVQLLAMHTKKSTRIIREILSRISIDREYCLEKIDLNIDQPLPLPQNSIPLEYTNVFELLLHTVSPGTKLTLRYAAILAIHAVSSSNILTLLAINFLDKVKGKWINWKSRDDGSVEVPDCWSQGFIDLISNPLVSFALTEEENNRVKKLVKLGYILRFYRQLEVYVDIFDSTSMDRSSYPEYTVQCTTCKYDRPLSLICEDGECGHCFLGQCSVVYQHKNMSLYYSNENTSGSISYCQVRCYTCGSFYSRDKTAYVEGYSKCYNCRDGHAPSPSVKCGKCGLNFIKFYEKPSGFDSGICKSCADGLEPRIPQYMTYNTYAHQILDPYFSDLCALLGYKVSGQITSGTSLYDAEKLITEDVVEHRDIPTCVLFRDSKITNVPRIWNYVLEVMNGLKPIDPECAICMDTFPPSSLTKACGRSRCLQRICHECSKKWYGQNCPGKILHQRALKCQICCRVPTKKILMKVEPRLVHLMKNISGIDDDAYYGWCMMCLKPSRLSTKECGGLIPNIINYCCESCQNIKTVDTKECPKCLVSIQKVGGCNHIECTNCSAHFCWLCKSSFSNSDETYAHMYEAHESIFDKS